MTKNELLATAKEIKQVSNIHATEYQSKRELLVDILNRKMLSRPDIEDLVGANNIEMMKDNHANHARFLESIFFNYSPEVFLVTVLWVFRAYRSRNFSSTYWAAQLNAWLVIYKEELSPECYKAIYPYYNWMQINIPSFNKLAEEELDSPLYTH